MNSKLKYVNCPVCGRHLLKVSGKCSIEIACPKCKKKIVGELDEKCVYVFEKELEDTIQKEI